MSDLLEIDRLMTFDLETTGVDVESDRIVTAFIGIMDVATGAIIQEWSWLLDPGVPIPVGASDVHGVTTERAQAEGRTDLGVAMNEMSDLLMYASMNGIPVVIYNAPFDLTMLRAEVERHTGFAGFEPPERVIDPFVIDKALDRYRKGKRTLSTVAEHYGIEVRDAHDARADCVMAGRLALELMRHPEVAIFDMDELVLEQVKMKATQSKSLRAYFQRQGEHEKAQTVDEAWPMKERPST